MISIEVVEKTAQLLMRKAAIEIPNDYYAGLKKAAFEEDGDLSSFVLEAMLENYAAAKEDGRAMCGDTGCPRWYVKMANEAKIDGGPVALEAALRRAVDEGCEGLMVKRLDSRYVPGTKRSDAWIKLKKDYIQVRVCASVPCNGKYTRVTYRCACWCPLGAQVGCVHAAPSPTQTCC